ncbi:MAG: hypothetical protein COV08_00080 [Candidatus Vogelbacteria bacterium CG10_big_fil_rev_8_21_14_0_10_49_38]|uniref:Uncharacterized protein n=1 Tax=Candidatus Vogelbacteria bacterium CG10_big_fil_rev_8_21_14_0_10_49_38 TaxID=1975043 RepID=A0A2H0RIT8_9BACT|nr:MAG: hypothetical protein BK006_00080 [bacterium CG10_49_38]PIR46472.1 MAG: hypothetical protein COV08_00080 [Candidatus Vogelbacteria bacterium CG10_big_fil_rev_8_21_14_0_10_49_38]
MKLAIVHDKKILFVFLTIIFLTIATIVFWRYPFGVKQYKTVALGMQAAQGAGTQTVWAPPYHIVPESNFYVYAIGDEPMCIGSDCGIGGYFIECLGGWLAGEKIITEEFDYGLRDTGVDVKKLKIITIADKEAKIVGIYPKARIRNLPYIMRKHRDLISIEVLKGCEDLLPRRW